VRELGLEDMVRFTGHVPYGEVGSYLGCATVCAATFPGERGDPGTISSLKIMTYLACGRPVMTSDMDEMGAVIRDAGAGDSVPPDDPGRLAAALVSLLREDEATWTRRGAAARRIAEQRTWRHKAARVAACLREVTGP
jgi:glycosyltransferase involved in cell wall biosynthesis